MVVQWIKENKLKFGLIVGGVIVAVGIIITFSILAANGAFNTEQDITIVNDGTTTSSDLASGWDSLKEDYTNKLNRGWDIMEEIYASPDKTIEDYSEEDLEDLKTFIIHEYYDDEDIDINIEDWFSSIQEGTVGDIA